MDVFPQIDNKLGLGVGLDLPWGGEIGMTKNGPTDKVIRFFDQYSSEFNYYFFSFQPKNRNILQFEEYYRAYDHLVQAVPAIQYRALHHTQLNMASPDTYSKQALIDFTNRLVERYQIRWINEDLGIWALRGKRLPYPLPPLMTEEGLDLCIQNVMDYQKGLSVPLCIEFPGYTEGTNFFIGKYDAFEYFTKVIEETGSPATLDTGHLLSYQWLMGKQEDFLEGLEKLPLESCFEIHLSGCEVVGDRFLDLHHGVLLDEQIEILDYLLSHCPNVKAVTYEDPKFDEKGHLIQKSVKNYELLKDRVKQWKDLPKKVA